MMARGKENCMFRPRHYEISQRDFVRSFNVAVGITRLRLHLQHSGNLSNLTALLIFITHSAKHIFSSHLILLQFSQTLAARLVMLKE